MALMHHMEIKSFKNIEPTRVSEEISIKFQAMLSFILIWTQVFLIEYYQDQMIRSNAICIHFTTYIMEAHFCTLSFVNQS